MKTRRSIAVFGAEETEAYADNALDLARELGQGIAKRGHVTVTNAAPGFCLWTAMGAREFGGSVIGFSPAASLEEHRDIYQLPTDYFDLIIYTGFGFSGRDIVATRSADAVLFGCGGVSVLHEFAGAFQMDKVTGVLEGPWKIDDVMHEVVNMQPKHRRVIFDEIPDRLVQKICHLLAE